ncbi:carbohydrate ABC transporter ATP-binding protein (CUT1 family) [Rhizobium sp. PP-WC-2G-219]|nr:carbohydrate ABC transporter ATP-binding protein (CUT1 family) [Rhizobium sp. PP-WC-2G-219]
MLELNGITKVGGAETHIHPTNLVLERGTLNVLLGPTLSGKTSLMRLMAGLDKPTTGTIHFDGKDVTGLPVQQRGVAMVYQQFINYPAFTVYENIASPMRIAGKDKATVDWEVRKAAEILKLTPYLDRMPLSLSGGQQQRTALARAIVKNAALVLLDEPLANLDYKLREELREELPKIFAASGAIFVYATTEPSEALLLGGNTATLSQGRISQFGKTIDVYRNPVDLFSARTFADPPLNVIGLTKKGSGFFSGSDAVLAVPSHLADISDGFYTIAFQPHHLSLHRPHTTASAVQARTIISEIAGSESFIHVAFGDHRWVMLVHGIHDIDADTDVGLFVDTRHLMAFDADGRAIAGYSQKAA